MKTFFPVFVLLIPLTNAVVQPESHTKELAKLQGKWKLIAVKAKDPLVEMLSKGLVTEFSKDYVTNTKDGIQVSKFKFKINPDAKPKEIDFIIEEAGITTEAIYEVAGDILKIRYPQPQKRPTSFDPKVDPEQPLLILKREK